MDSSYQKYQNLNQKKSYKSCQEDELNEEKQYTRLQTSVMKQILVQKKTIQEQQLMQALFNLRNQQCFSEENFQLEKLSNSSNQNCKIYQELYCPILLTKTKSQQVKIKLKQEKRGQCEGKKKKNFLTIIKRCILRLYYHQLSLIEDEKIKIFIQQKAKSNRVQFQNLFKNEEARRFIADIFTDKKLERQIQLTRVDGQNRKLFIAQINKLRKRFCSKTFIYE